MTRLPSLRPPDNGPTYRVEPLTPTSFYLCQLCGNLARYPREKKHTFRFPFGFSWTVIYQFPWVCMNCRLARPKEMLRERGGGRFRFWKRFFAVYLDDPYPSIDPWTWRLLEARRRIVRWWRSIHHA